MWPWKKPQRPQAHRNDLSLLFQQQCDHWEQEALNTLPSEREAAETAATQLYQHTGLESPRFIWCESPVAFFEALYYEREQGSGREIWEEIGASRTLLMNTIEEIFAVECQRILQSLPLYMALHRRHGLNETTLLLAVEKELRKHLPRITFAAPPATLATTFRQVFQMLPPVQELVRITIYEEAGLALPEPTWQLLRLWRTLTESCAWWWPCEEVCLFCERPVLVSRDEAQRLHSPSGPALQYPDGWQVYAWHGTLARADIIEQPETITSERIEQEQNVEARRLMIERFGEARYLGEYGVKLVHADTMGTLYCREVIGEEPIMMVRVQNSTPEPDGTLKIYRLRVPPWMRTAREAVAWTFSLTEDTYAPMLET